MSKRLERLQKLEQAVHEFVNAEKERIDAEVQSLEAILSGRTGGEGLTSTNVSLVTELAQNDLAGFLKET